MVTANIKRTIISTLCVFILGGSAWMGCSQGDTDGDNSASDAQNDRPQYVSDGGAGGSITIRINGDLSVGGQVGFFVDLADAQGQPLQYVRVFCESEKGIAIIEPSSGGTAFESTGPDGSMSGVLGGLLPGSFLLECRAPEGFNLVARERVKISGSVPAGFEGFPGAAGGNLGGGVIVDQEPDAEDVNGVRITNIDLYDNGGTDSATTVIDINSSLCTDSEQEDKYFFSTFALTIANPLSERVIVDNVVINSNGVSTTVGLGGCEVAGGDTATCGGPFADFNGNNIPGNNIGKTLVGTTASFTPGSYNLDFEINFTLENGESGSNSTTKAVTFEDVNNCQ